MDSLRLWVFCVFFFLSFGVLFVVYFCFNLNKLRNFPWPILKEKFSLSKDNECSGLKESEEGGYICEMTEQKVPLSSRNVELKPQCIF